MLQPRVEIEELTEAKLAYEKNLVKNSELYIVWFFYGTIFFWILHHWISNKISSKLFPAYQLMSYEKRMEWDSRVVSSVHAAIVSVLCLKTLWQDVDMWTEPVLNSSYSGFLAMTISASYMTVDALSMPLYWKFKEFYLYWIHHAVVVYSAYSILHFRAGLFFGIYRLVTEVSTPSLNLRWFFRNLNYSSDSWPVSLCTFTFSILFISSRFFPIPYYWLTWIRCYFDDNAQYQIHLRPWIVLEGFLLGGSLDVLNILWSYSVLKLTIRTAKNLYVRITNQNKADTDQHETLSNSTDFSVKNSGIGCSKTVQTSVENFRNRMSPANGETNSTISNLTPQYNDRNCAFESEIDKLESSHRKRIVVQ